MQSELWEVSAHNGKAKQFCFSNHYFQNQEFPIEEAIDTIRHEYAHYMDFVLNVKHRHSTSWKQYCIRIGALPNRLYSEDRADYHRKKHEKDRQENVTLDQLSPGMIIEHLRFDHGIVFSSSGSEKSRILRSLFQQLGRKLLVHHGC